MKKNAYCLFAAVNLACRRACAMPMLVATLAMLLVPMTSPAASYTWTTGTTGTPVDGSGTWSTTGNTRWELNGAGAAVNWVSGSDAVIGANNGAAGTITIPSSTTISVSSITFNPPGSGAYSIAAGTASSSLIGLSSTADTTLTVANGVTVTAFGVNLTGGNASRNLNIINNGTISSFGASTGNNADYLNANTIVSGSGTLTFVAGTHNYFNGSLVINGGTVKAANAANFTAAQTITLNNSGTLNNNGQSLTFGTMVLNGGTWAGTGTEIGTVTTLDARSGSATSALASGNKLSAATVNKTTAGTVTLYTKRSSSTIGLGAVNLFGGTLTLDYSVENNLKFMSTAPLNFGGGALVLAGGTTADTVSATTVSPGASSLTRASGTSSLALKAITRNAGGTLDVGTGSFATTTSGTANTVLGGYATIAGSDWLVLGASSPFSMTALASYTTMPSSGGAATDNALQTGGATATGNITINTLKIANSANSDTLALGANNLTLTAGGGLLYVGGSDNNYTISGSGIIGAGAANEFIVYNKIGTLSIGAPIIGSGAGGLTKSGPGTLLLGGASSYTGNTYVNQGSLVGNTAGSASGSAATVAMGATNGVQVAAANGKWVWSALTFNAGTTYADFDFATADVSPSTSAANAPLQASGNLTLQNSTTDSTNVTLVVRLGATPIPTGTYPLIKYGNASALTAAQFASFSLLITSGYTGHLVNNTGAKTIDLVVDSSPAVAAIALSDAGGSQVAAANVAPSVTKVPLHQSQLAVTTANATLNAVSFTTAGTYVAADVAKFQVWYNTANTIVGATQLGADITTGLGAGSHSVSGLSQAISVGNTGYIFITMDVASGATIGNTINVTALAPASFTFASGNVSGSTTDGGAQAITAIPTITAGTITGFGGQEVNTTSSTKSYNLSGIYLTPSSGDLTVTPPAGFEVSLDGSTWVANPSVLNVSYSGGTLAATPISVRFVPTSVTAYSGNIANAGGGATTVNTAVSGTGVYSSSSDIIADTGFSYPQNIAYGTYQETDLTSASLAVGQFILRDGGASADADAADTTLTAVSFTVANSANLRRVALYDGATELAEVAAGATVTFSGLSVTAVDGGTKTLTLRASFQSTVTDNQQFSFTVSSATASASGSGFAAGNAGGAATSTAGNINKVVITATKLAFSTVPSTASPNFNFTVTVQAQDVNNNVDLDSTASVTLSRTAGSGTLSSVSGLTQTLVAGSKSWTDVQYDTIETFTLQAADNASLLTSASTSVTVAQDSYTWTSTTGGSTTTDGAGTWGTANANWRLSGAGTAVNWINSANQASIGNGGAGGTITVSGAITAGNITFNTVSSPYTVSGGTSLTLAGTPTIAVNNSGGATISTPLVGSFALNGSATANTLTLSGTGGASTATVTINGGTLSVTGNSALADATAITINNGGIYRAANNPGATIAMTATVNTGGKLTFATTGTSQILGTKGNQRLTLAGGTVDASVTGRAPTMPVDLTADSTLGSVANVNTLTFSGAFTIKSATRQLTIAQPMTISGVIGNDTTGAGLTKAGSATLTLSGASTYDGPTTVSTGTLLITGDNSGLSGNTSVSSGATLSGTGTLGGNVTYQSGALATFTLTSPMRFSGNLTFNGNTITVNIPANLGNGTYNLAICANAIGGTVNSTPTIGTGSLASGASGSLSLSGNNLVLTVTGGPAAQTYTWNGGSSGAWNVAANWSPTRTSPATTDTLQFNTGGTVTATAVPSEFISQLAVSGNTTVNLTAGTAGNTLTILGGSGTDLSVAAGSQLNTITTAENLALISGATAVINGSMTFSTAATTFTCPDVGGITFQNGSSFTADSSFSGSAFGTVNLNSVIFTSGSTYVHKAGANPFGAGQPASVVTFQSGSLYSVQANLAPSLSGRTYANVEINSASFSQTGTGGSALSIDNLTVTAGSLTLGMTGTFNLKGNVSVASGATLNFTPASAGTLTLNGTATQTISGSGTLVIEANCSASVANSAGVVLSKNITVNGGLTVNTGSTLDAGTSVISGTGTFTLSSGGGIKTSHASGIPGNITTSTKVFSSGANYTFNGTAGQATGVFTTTPVANTVNDLTIANAAGVTASDNLSVAGALNLSYASGSPALALATDKTLTLANNTTVVTVVGGTPLSAGSYKLVAKAGAGTVAGTTGALSLGGVGAVSGSGSTLAINGGELFLNIGPTATNITYSRGKGISLKISKADILAHTSTPTGETLTLTFDAVTANSVTLSNDSTYIYVPAETAADSFGYTVTASPSGTSASATITINVVDSTGQNSGSINTTGGNPNLTFYGIPGNSYSIQRAEDVNFTVNLTTLTTVTVGGNGVITYTDTAPPTPMAFYRLIYNP